MTGDDRATGATKLRIACRPAWRSANTYTSMLAEQLEKVGFEVGDFDYRSYRTFTADIILFHWPDEFFVRRSFKSVIKAMLLLLALAATKLLSKQKIVWIVHNIEPHDRGGGSFVFARTCFFRRLDGLIFLSRTSRSLAIARYPELATKPFAVITHGNYKSGGNSPVQPLSLPEAGPISLAFTGQVKRYKAPDALLRAAHAMPPGQVRISISGSCTDVALADEIRQLAGQLEDARLDLRYLSDAEIEACVDAAHAVVLPYRDILNSGSALLALSRARPVLAPRLGSLVELQGQVGDNWLYLYDGEFDTAMVLNFLDWLRNTPRGPEPDLSAHDWDAIGNELSRFLKPLARI